MTQGTATNVEQQAVALKEAGNALFRKRDYAGAAAKYEEALQLALQSADNLPRILLQNIAAAFLQLKQPLAALVHAGGVLVFPLHECSIKAHYRAAKAADELGVPDASVWPLALMKQSNSSQASHIAHDVAKLMSELENRTSISLKDARREIHSPEAQVATSSPSRRAQLVFVRTVLQAVVRSAPELEPSARRGSDTDEQADALQLKEAGNVAFRSKAYTLAVSKWREALSTFTLIPAILSNLASVLGYLEMSGKAMLSAATVLAFQPHSVKAYARAASVASILGLCPTAVDFAQAGLKFDPSHRELQRIKRDASKKVAERIAADGGDDASGSQPAGVRSEDARKDSEIEAEGDPRMTKVRRELKILHEQKPHELVRIERIAGPVPDELDKYFLAMKSLPEGCQKQAVSKRLCEGAATAIARWMALYGATKFSNADMSEPTRFEENNSNVVRRLVHVTPERQQWLWEGPIGSISRAVKAPHHNHAELLQSFNNAAEHPLPIPAEGVHVAVGFVDLGVLAETLAAHQKQQSEHGQGSCLKWVGIEKSAFCCAKMLVVSHMLQQRMDAHTIAQVWYSAGWTSAASHAFRTSVAALLGDQGVLESLTAEVKKWLHAWQGCKVPLAKARAVWLERMERDFAHISNLLRKDDRMAAAHYAVCGDVIVPPTETVQNDRRTSSVQKVVTGSVVMFAERKGHACEYAIDEHFLFSLPPDDLVEERLMQGKTFHAAGAVLVRRRVEALARALQAKQVTIEIRHAQLWDDNQSEVNHIRLLAPSSMSWSNLCDYMHASTFHRLARRCSSPSTQHFMQSLNWSLEKGKRQATMNLLQEARKAVKQNIKEKRAERLLRVAPLDKSKYVFDALLFQRMLPKWLEAFCADARSTGRGSIASCEVLHSPEYWHFSLHSSLVHFRLQYE